MSIYRIIATGQRIKCDSPSFMDQQYGLGNWVDVTPAPVVMTHLTEFTPQQLLNSFTSTESFLSLKSANVDVKTQAELLAVKRDVKIAIGDAGYISAIEDLRSESILDSDTADSYLLGIPVERL